MVHPCRISLPASLRSDRLVLRRWETGDVKAVMHAIVVSLEQLRLWMPWAQEMPTRESVRFAIERGRDRFDAGEHFDYFLFETGTDELVGAVAVHPTAPGTAEIGYWIRSDRHRRGYATEAAQALTRAAFRHLPSVSVVEIRMDQANVASAGVPARTGFRLLGDDESRDRVTPGHTGRGWIWAVDRPTWESMSAPDADQT
jgi:RimJ/RimL family protein N-acetyltransferase